MNIFHRFDEIDWGKGMVLVTMTTIFWTGLISIVPAKYHNAGIVLLTAAQGSLMYAAKSRRPEVRTRKDDTPLEQPPTV